MVRSVKVGSSALQGNARLHHGTSLIHASLWAFDCRHATTHRGTLQGKHGAAVEGIKAACTLTDLCPEDKEKVARLLKQVTSAQHEPAWCSMVLARRRHQHIHASASARPITSCAGGGHRPGSAAAEGRPRNGMCEPRGGPAGWGDGMLAQLGLATATMPKRKCTHTTRRNSSHQHGCVLQERRARADEASHALDSCKQLRDENKL